MKFYSEVTKSFYDSAKSCEEAEKEYNKALDEKKEKEKRQVQPLSIRGCGPIAQPDYRRSMECCKAVKTPSEKR